MASLELPYFSMGHLPAPETVHSFAGDVHQCSRSNPDGGNAARADYGQCPTLLTCDRI
jgi:hypothetical protein